MKQPRMRISAAVLGAPDASTLAAFYQRLLGWTVVRDHGDWVMLKPPTGGTGLAFQTEAEYRPPVWPSSAGTQQMMMHLDIAAEDLDEGEAWAVSAGARVADHQPQDDVRVMLDPAGHPFCLFAGKA